MVKDALLTMFLLNVSGVLLNKRKYIALISDLITVKEAKDAINQYMMFYNDQRLHQSLDYQTPANNTFCRSISNP